MFTKHGRDEELMAPHMYLGVSARSTQGRIQGWAKIGHGGLLPEPSSDRKATATNRMYNNVQEAIGMKCRYLFCFIPESNFLCINSSQVSDSGPLGLSLS